MPGVLTAWAGEVRLAGDYGRKKFLIFMKGKSIGKIHEGSVRLEHHPAGWLSHAYELRKVEEMIYMDILKEWDQHQIMDATKNFKPSQITPTHVHLLMIGLAIENILKCMFLNKHPEILDNGEIKNGLFRTHNLTQIATQVLMLTLSDDEKFMLELGEKAIKWYGRYPIPLKEKDTLFIVETNRTRVHLAFHTLFERLAPLAKIKHT